MTAISWCLVGLYVYIAGAEKDAVFAFCAQPLILFANIITLIVNSACIFKMRPLVQELRDYQWTEEECDCGDGFSYNGDG